MTEPPEDSTAVVSWLTAAPPAGTSRRMVIEYETLGAVAMAGFLCFPWCCAAHRPPRRVASPDRRTYRPVAGNRFRRAESVSRRGTRGAVHRVTHGTRRTPGPGRTGEGSAPPSGGADPSDPRL
ncbi:hypothetical protein GCM10023079_11130 [Streptomyces chitinivorans]